MEQLNAIDDKVANFRFLTMREFYFRDEDRDPVGSHILQTVHVTFYL